MMILFICVRTKNSIEWSEDAKVSVDVTSFVLDFVIHSYGCECAIKKRKTISIYDFRSSDKLWNIFAIRVYSQTEWTPEKKKETMAKLCTLWVVAVHPTSNWVDTKSDTSMPSTKHTAHTLNANASLWKRLRTTDLPSLSVRCEKLALVFSKTQINPKAKNGNKLVQFRLCLCVHGTRLCLLCGMPMMMSASTTHTHAQHFVHLIFHYYRCFVSVR